MSQSLREIAENARMPESTLRLYRDEFEELVGAKGEGRRRRYDERAAEVLTRIAEWKKAGWKSDAIRDELKKRGRPEAQARRRTTEDRLDELILLVRQQSQELASLRTSVEAQKNEIARLRGNLGVGAVSYDEALRGR
jgi:DNA-binding transcriptional MerR regulator